MSSLQSLSVATRTRFSQHVHRIFDELHPVQHDTTFYDLPMLSLLACPGAVKWRLSQLGMTSILHVIPEPATVLAMYDYNITRAYLAEFHMSNKYGRVLKEGEIDDLIATKGAGLLMEEFPHLVSPVIAMDNDHGRRWIKQTMRFLEYGVEDRLQVMKFLLRHWEPISRETMTQISQSTVYDPPYRANHFKSDMFLALAKECGLKPWTHPHSQLWYIAYSAGAFRTIQYWMTTYGFCKLEIGEVSFSGIDLPFYNEGDIEAFFWLFGKECVYKGLKHLSRYAYHSMLKFPLTREWLMQSDTWRDRPRARAYALLLDGDEEALDSVLTLFPLDMLEVCKEIMRDEHEFTATQKLEALCKVMAKEQEHRLGHPDPNSLEPKKMSIGISNSTSAPWISFDKTWNDDTTPTHAYEIYNRLVELGPQSVKFHEYMWDTWRLRCGISCLHKEFMTEELLEWYFGHWKQELFAFERVYPQSLTLTRFLLERVHGKSPASRTLEHFSTIPWHFPQVISANAWVGMDTVMASMSSPQIYQTYYPNNDLSVLDFLLGHYPVVANEIYERRSSFVYYRLVTNYPVWRTLKRHLSHDQLRDMIHLCKEYPRFDLSLQHVQEMWEIAPCPRRWDGWAACVLRWACMEGKARVARFLVGFFGKDRRKELLSTLNCKDNVIVSLEL